MKFNIVDFIFINFTFFIIIVGGLMNLIEPYLPILIRQSFRYGKISYNGEKKNEFVTKLEVPKSWFKHFYVFAFAWTLIGFILISQCSITLTPTYNIVIRFLDFIAGEKSRDIQIDSTSALCAIFLLFLQCCRRFYETHFMQIFSSNSKINLSHYIVGYFHYFGAVLAILMNTEGFVQGSTPSPINFSTFSFYKIGFVMFFLYCWFHQYSSNRILVNLRKNHNGKIVTEEHLLPKGGYFDYVSSPHLLFEILIYIGLAGIIPNCVSWKYALTWVAVNQNFDQSIMSSSYVASSGSQFYKCLHTSFKIKKHIRSVLFSVPYTGAGFLSLLMNIGLEHYLPLFIRYTLRWGKLRERLPKNCFIKKFFLLDKIYLSHTYFVACCAAVIPIHYLYYFHYEGTLPADLYFTILDKIFGEDRQIYVRYDIAIFMFSFYFGDCAWRAYFSYNLQSYSQGSKINIICYLFAMLNHIFTILSIMAHTECFVKAKSPPIDIDLAPVTANPFNSYLKAIYHFNAYFIVFNIMHICGQMARSREDNEGYIRPNRYVIINGAPFEYISSPRNVFDVMLNITYWCLVSGCVTFRFIAIWNILFQIQTAWLTHKWYKSHFKHYPKERKALIPYVL